MKEFIINLLILLSSPFYVLAVLLLSTISLVLKFERKLARIIDKCIEFMKSDYNEAYKIIKNTMKK